MAKKNKDAPQDPNAELLPPREVLSLLNPDPSAYAGGLLADPTAAGAGTTDPTAGTADAASSTAGSAHDLADAQAAGDGQQTVSDQPQTITTDSTQSASSET
jgi:hypothetical protein